MTFSEFNNLVRLEEDTHKYYRNSDNQELQSVSRVLALLKEPFDAKTVSARMTNSPEEALKLQSEWNDMAQQAIDWGKMCHSECENFFKYGSVKNSSFSKLNTELTKIAKYYKKSFAEYILHDNQRLIAGTADHIGLRNKVGKYIIVDVNDFKTNIRKGIMNFSGKSDENGEFVKYYNKFLLHPLEHLQDCNYIIYCLQLSIYAYMIEHLYDNVKIGALNIFFVDRNLNIKPIPVPYMRYEAMLVLNNYVTAKDLITNELISNKLKKGSSATLALEAVCNDGFDSDIAVSGNDEWV